MEDIQNNLDYFSELTQRTLSAFHISGTDVSLINEIQQVKRYVANYKSRILITVEEHEGKYKRFFHDGFEDIVDKAHIKKPSYYEDEGIRIIEEGLNRKLGPITAIKYGDIDTSPRKPIELISERLFFIDMVDYT